MSNLALDFFVDVEDVLHDAAYVKNGADVNHDLIDFLVDLTHLNSLKGVVDAVLDANDLVADASKSGNADLKHDVNDVVNDLIKLVGHSADLHHAV